MSGIKLVGDWKKAKAILAAGPAAVKAALPQAVMQEALHYEATMKKLIGKGVAPIAPRANGSSRPLVKSGDLRNSIHAEKDGEFGAFIGINKQASGHGGKAYDIARVHEFGATIVQVMTDKQRRYLFAVVFKGEAKAGAGSGAAKGFLLIRIPARPFVAPTFAAESPKSPRRFVAILAKLLQPAGLSDGSGEPGGSGGRDAKGRFTKAKGLPFLMAVPTISSVSPSSGIAGGQQLARITGTGFALPPAPPATGVVPVPPPSVTVTVGGRVSPRVLVLSSTDIRFVVPAGAPSVPRDVVVQNNDSNGDPIAGEVATAVGAYTYRLPDYAASGWTTQRVVRRLLALVKEQFLPNTVHTTHVDYDSAPGDGLNRVEVASLPACVVHGPEYPENAFYTSNPLRVDSAGDGTFVVRPPPHTVDMLFTVVVFDDSSARLLNLAEAWCVFVNANDFLVLPRAEGGAPGVDDVSYEFDFTPDGSPKGLDVPSNSNVRCWRSMVLVRGVDLDGIDDRAVDVTVPVGEVTDPVTGAAGPHLDLDEYYQVE